ncbi:serine hydrolase [Paenibacillus sp. SYP-B3998]|uniref:Serine hydrolase n=1 Tax=Paenibacillus sp. SYP-B3998 TaxID=2678564 RepID=A0A6G3ZXD3_9BACL|nr:serine hydrolase [Paenibacillus sp. SYP-B3998]
MAFLYGPCTNRNLDYQPGEEYLYATVDYDVLGLIIERVTGQSDEGS